MTTITDIQNLPNGTVVDAVQVKVVSAYERKTGVGKTGNSSVQNCVLEDSLGNKIRAGVWDHPDLTELKGKEVILHSTEGRKGKGGVTVKFNDYNGKVTIELAVSKQGQFQYVEVFKGANPEIPAKSVSSPSDEVSPSKGTNVPEARHSAPKAIFGATVGMALNNAQNECAATGEDPTEQALWEKASKYIRVAQRLESGDLATEGNPF